MSAKPLAHLKVLDLGTFIAAPFCATILAEFGAEVVKIEIPGKGDSLGFESHGAFVVTPTGSLGWFGRGGPVDRLGRNTGSEGVWTFDASGDILMPCQQSDLYSRRSLSKTSPSVTFVRRPGFGLG